MTPWRPLDAKRIEHVTTIIATRRIAVLEFDFVPTLLFFLLRNNKEPDNRRSMNVWSLAIHGISMITTVRRPSYHSCCLFLSGRTIVPYAVTHEYVGHHIACHMVYRTTHKGNVVDSRWTYTGRRMNENAWGDQIVVGGWWLAWAIHINHQKIVFYI